MILRRVFSDRSSFLFCVGMHEHTSGALGIALNRQHVRRNVTSAGTRAPLDTETLLQRLVNYEQQGVPNNAGTNGNKGFDLVRSIDSPKLAFALQLCLSSKVCCLAGGPT